MVDRALLTEILVGGVVGQCIKTDLWMWHFLVGLLGGAIIHISDFFLDDEQEETSLPAMIGAKLLITVVTQTLFATISYLFRG